MELTLLCLSVQLVLNVGLLGLRDVKTDHQLSCHDGEIGGSSGTDVDTNGNVDELVQESYPHLSRPVWLEIQTQPFAKEESAKGERVVGGCSILPPTDCSSSLPL